MPTGSRCIEIAQRHIGEKYVLGARARLTNPHWRGPWDCAEFVSWCVYQATGVAYGTSNNSNPAVGDPNTGFWQTQSQRDGVQITVHEAAQIPGAILLRFPQRRRIGHIAFSLGDGIHTIEAHSRRYGVCYSLVTYHNESRGWNCGVLVPGVKY